ncbi:MAG: hypothetical protein IPJ88_02245 [Myxococcales bacterium]|nr:MAG: hypothetical protein IPJ88_02245 [Myxococcales bacterium]
MKFLNLIFGCLLLGLVLFNCTLTPEENSYQQDSDAISYRWNWLRDFKLQSIKSAAQQVEQLNGGSQQARDLLELPYVDPARKNHPDEIRLYVATLAGKWNPEVGNSHKIRLYAWQDENGVPMGVTIGNGQHRVLALIHQARMLGEPEPTIDDIPSDLVEIIYNDKQNRNATREKFTGIDFEALYRDLFLSPEEALAFEHGAIDRQFFHNGEWFIKTGNGVELVLTNHGWKVNLDSVDGPATDATINAAFLEKTDAWFAHGNIENDWGYTSPNGNFNFHYEWTNQDQVFTRTPCPLGDHARAGKEDEECYDLQQIQGKVSRFEVINQGGRLVEIYNFNWQENPEGNTLYDCGYSISRYTAEAGNNFFVSRALSCEPSWWAAAKRAATYVFVIATTYFVAKAYFAKESIEEVALAIVEEAFERAVSGEALPVLFP